VDGWTATTIDTNDRYRDLGAVLPTVDVYWLLVLATGTSITRLEFPTDIRLGGANFGPLRAAHLRLGLGATLVSPRAIPRALPSLSALRGVWKGVVERVLGGY
jgi:hypothetical protein